MFRGGLAWLVILVLSVPGVAGRSRGEKQIPEGRPRSNAARTPERSKTELRPQVEAFDTELEQLRALLKIPGMSAAIVQGKNVFWAKGYGLREVDRKLSSTPETLYPVASITKTFTAVLVMQMVEQGKLRLDDPVSKYRADPDVGPEVTVRHYLSHASEGVAGERFSYNGERYARLAAILEKASGKSYRALLQQNIFDKLNMENSIPGLAAARDEAQRFEEPIAHLARPYALMNGSLAELMYAPPPLDGASGVISTVLDLGKYVAALRENTLVSTESRDLMFAPGVSTRGKKLPYGLGWFVEESHGHKLIWHYGQERGMSSLLLLVPDRDLALILLANSSALSEPFWLLYGNLLHSPFALAFLRTVALPRAGDAPLDRKVSRTPRSGQLTRAEGNRPDDGDELIARALAYRWIGEKAKSNQLFRLALERHPGLGRAADPVLLSDFARSGDPALRVAGEKIGRALLREDPANTRTLFDLGVLYLQAKRAGQALPLFEKIVGNPRGTNRALLAWSAYFLGELLAESDPARARKCFQVVLDTGYNEENLAEQARAAMNRLKTPSKR